MSQEGEIFFAAPESEVGLPKQEDPCYNEKRGILRGSVP